MPFSPIDEFFLNDKMLASIISSYKVRSEQLEMSHLVHSALQEKKHLLVEAGTGVGKTLAYLVPALIYAAEHKKKIAISTHTIALQQQLITQGVPLVKKLLSLDVRVLEVLGMNNFLCLHKLEEKRGQNSLFQLKDDRFEEMHTRSGQGQGTKRNVPSHLLPLWPEVAATKEQCLHTECEFFKDCFFYKNRKEAQDAQVLIMNHHLLLIDLMIKSEREDGSGLFPAYDALIVDEAHQLEPVAKKQLTFAFSLKNFAQEVNGIKLDKPQAKKRVLDAAHHFFAALENTNFVRFAGKILQVGDLQEVIFIQEAIPALKVLQQEITALESDLALKAEESKTEPVWDLGQVKMRIEELSEALTAFNPLTHALWIEKKPETTLLLSRPEISGMLSDLLFSHKIPQIFSSATLSVKGSFDFFKKSIGLHSALPLTEKILHSPYNYVDNVFFALTEDLPLPEDRNFTAQANLAIFECIQACQAQTFVLFTSYEALFAAKRDLGALIARLGMDLICQSEMDTNDMVELMRRKQKMVLFGTDTFWEGVDVKGLKLIILTKLPFASPHDPRQEALGHVLSSQGKNFFMEAMLPQAAIKFKQGFGRLIRSETDRGAVICLDKRLQEKSYGKTFIQSLPSTPLHVDKLKNITEKLKDFLERSGIEPLTSTMPLLRSTN